MTITEITDKKKLNDFFEKNGSPSFLQSWEWGEIQEHSGYRVKRLGLFKQKQLIAIAQVVEIKSKRGNFLFVPHGPISQKFLISNFQFLIKYLKEIAKNENYSFIRIAPILKDSSENRRLFSDLGFKVSPIYMHAERVWVLPLEKPEDQLLAEMRKTTRYSIRKAERDGVVIEKRTDEKAIQDFYHIYEKTADRENFVAFSKKFIRDEFECFHKTGNAGFFEAVHPSGVLASALIIFTKSTAFYHQGASIHSKIPATYLLQWKAIKEAKKRGCKFYNFWGTLQEGRTPKNWAGLTLFKQGFGGGEVDYVPTQDYIISLKYYFTYVYETYLKWRRGV